MLPERNEEEVDEEELTVLEPNPVADDVPLDVTEELTVLDVLLEDEILFDKVPVFSCVAMLLDVELELTWDDELTALEVLVTVLELEIGATEEVTELDEVPLLLEGVALNNRLDVLLVVVSATAATLLEMFDWTCEVELVVAEELALDEDATAEDELVDEEELNDEVVPDCTSEDAGVI